MDELKILVIVLIVALLVALWMDWRRGKAEQKVRDVEDKIRADADEVQRRVEDATRAMTQHKSND